LQEYNGALQILETINICPSAPKTPYKARLTAQALAVKATVANSIENFKKSNKKIKMIKILINTKFCEIKI